MMLVVAIRADLENMHTVLGMLWSKDMIHTLLPAGEGAHLHGSRRQSEAP